LNDDWPENYDVITCSLFLHHLASDQIIPLLRKASQQAKQLILFSDLIRCRRGMLLAKLACNLLTKSDVVRVDGPRSVRAALTKKEISDLAERAGLTNFQMTSHWPSRYLLQWRRPGVSP
jgi:2-polyprenyl-3-methyl-5-hydroxy-6-metoxy-1,4-benzoquinol methylase